MKTILNNEDALKCLDNNIVGIELYNQMSLYAENAYKNTNKFNSLEFDGIICILRAALPLALSLYKISGKNVGFISARRREDLSIEINYKNVPEFKNPLIVDGWIASGNTVVEVAKELGINKINLFGLIASKQALELIKPNELIVGYVAEKMTEKTYIIPPEPYKPRDGGNDLFLS
jgi:uracil phosphoribosyltransferase